MLHIHFHFCKCDTIFCCFGSGEALPSKPPPSGPSTLIQTQPQQQGAMRLSWRDIMTLEFMMLRLCLQ
ncbi:uncharacterized protein H6S33_001351 [Morchella sextelata]|uniref:uncharacterized protein n=1 Tax=Morchella sextelata TaxID=1174677 RepID=UPI001D054881|nr:uncharacterized protein H6S33_001351 [Morchella sextelata]KAH0609123.1 hypothetical protein H6S33_001351 [Morchella sextelata]